MADMSEPAILALLLNLRARLDIEGETTGPGPLEDVLLRRFRQLTGAEALLLERRLRGLARALESLGPSASLEEVAALARSYERQPN